MTTPRLGVTELIAKQSQPHLPLNAGLRRIEQGASRFVVISVSLSTPPVSPMDGDAYLVAATPAAMDDWFGKENHVAYYSGNDWLFVPPLLGFEARVAGGDRYLYSPGSPPAWVPQVVSSTFLALTDTPDSYTGQALQGVRVNAAATALEFFTVGAGGGSSTQCIPIAISDETTALTASPSKVTFRMPYAFTLTGVRASLTTAPTGSALVVDINETGVSILSTKLSIDATEKTSTTAATPAVISDASLADDAEITIDIDQVGSTLAGAGLKVYLIGTKT